MRTETGSPSIWEQHTIAPIPADQRHGHPRDLLRLWFGVNFMPLTVVTGVLGPTVFGLNFTWTFIAILVGNLVGAIFMALHSVQGAVLGVPQMIQSRGQFGNQGSVLVMLMVLLMYIGFLASILVLGGQSLQAMTSAIGLKVGIVVTGLVTAAIVIVGYRLIHLFNRFAVILFGAAVVAFFIWAFAVKGIPAAAFTHGGHSLTGILGMASVAAVWQIAYAPYVSDYSRYMPKTIDPAQTFWLTWAGTVIGGAVLMIVGGIVGAYLPTGQPVTVVGQLTPGIVPLIMLVFFLGAVDASVINLYGPVLVFITLVQTFRSSWRPGAKARTVLTAVWTVLALYLALFLANGFLNNYSNFITGLLYVLVPWSAINLVDYYWIRRGNYDVASFFRADGGIYGRVRWPAVIGYLAGVLCQIPFMDLTFYQGFLVKFLGGVDVAWLVGLVVSVVVYYPLAARGPAIGRRAENSDTSLIPAPEASE
jgi:nucleobase:cation symporter-1, NCS1 family